MRRAGRRSAGGAVLFDEAEQLRALVDSGCCPPCFESRQDYQEWRYLARLTGLSPLAICRDCLPEYQASMKARGRCLFQWAEFTADGDEGVVGRVPGMANGELT